MSKTQENIADFRSGTLAEGLQFKREILVGPDRVITFMGEDLQVYETPSMIADIEYACRDLLFAHLPDGWDSVGVLVDIEHLTATPMNELVTVQIEICEIDRRRVRFQCEVHDAEELAGRGIHDRFIVAVAKHRQRVVQKRERMQSKN